MPTNPTNKDQNSVFSRINYLEKQKLDPKKTEKEIKILDLRIDNLFEMLRDDQEEFKKGGVANGKAIMKARGGTFKGTF